MTTFCEATCRSNTHRVNDDFCPACRKQIRAREDDISTTSGERFSLDDHARLAFLIYRRWGRNIEAAAVAWRRLFQNSCTDGDFEEVVNRGSLLAVERGEK